MLKKYQIYYRVFVCPLADQVVKRPVKAARCTCMNCREIRCAACTGSKRMRGGCQDCTLPGVNENENYFPR
jgi:hypothetical protein